MNSKTNNFESAWQALLIPHFAINGKVLFIIISVFFALPAFSQTAPPAPTSVSASPLAVCPSSPYTFLKAVSVGNTIKWYTVETGGTAIGSSNSGGSFYVKVTEPTTYYAESVSPAAVTSTSRTSVMVGVNTVPVITYMPPDVTANNEAGQCGTIVTYPSASAIGTPTPNIVYSDSSGANFAGGSTTVIVSAVNVCATTSLSFDVTVNDVESPGMFAPTALDLTAPDGATTVANPDLGLATATDNCGIMAIYNDAPAEFQAGTTVVTWTAIDYNGNKTVSTQLVNVTVNYVNQPPVITTAYTNNTDNIVAQGSTVNLTVNWNDEENGGPYTVTIDWRDSSAVTVLTGVNSHSIITSHTYNKTGVFSPVITVTDGNNESDLYIFKFIVVYANASYCTTAAGQFYAPPGSVLAQPNLSYANRRAEFGSHCKTKCNQPGQFSGEFHLNIAGAHYQFETSNADWDYLAVSGCYLAEFRGSGYMYPNGHKGSCKGGCNNACNAGVNPGYEYGILIVQSDRSYNTNCKNKIRIKIWNKTLNDEVIFDTQYGDPDDALPTTNITSGNCHVRVPSSCVPRLLNPLYDDNRISDDQSADFSTVVSPNPFADQLQVTFNSVLDEKVSISVYDVYGKLVQTLPDALPNRLVTIENMLMSGIYFIHAVQNGHLQITKVIKI